MKSPATRSAPMVFDDITKGCGGGAIHHELDIMGGGIRAIIDIDPARIVGIVVRGIPTTVGDIETSGECDGVVNNNDFLMMRCAQGMTAVEEEVNSSMGSPGMSIERNDLSVCGINHRKIPKQNVDMDVAVATHKIMQEVAKSGARRICRKKTEAAIELPAIDEDRMPRALESRCEG